MVILCIRGRSYAAALDPATAIQRQEPMMPRRSLIFVVVLAAALMWPLTAFASAREPILAGPWSLNQEGYGHVRPRAVFNGGDPTGLIRRIEWLTWGGPRAVGVGISTYVAPGQITAEGRPESAVIVLFKLGTCHGRRAYDAIQWYFPEHGEHFDPHRAGYKICTGA
jgi:hypothetical protein